MTWMTRSFGWRRPASSDVLLLNPYPPDGRSVVVAGMLTERPGKPAQSPATAGADRLPFQTGHGRQAHPGLIGQLFLGQTLLAA